MDTNPVATETDTEDQYNSAIGSEQAYAIAAEQDLEVVLPKLNELQVDIDSEADYEAFKKQIDRFRRCVEPVKHYYVAPSKSGKPGKYHITVTLENNISRPELRIAFQLMLGSDRTREILSFARFANDDPHPTLFFEKRPGVTVTYE